MAFDAERFQASDRAPAWSKITAIQNALDRGADPVVWIDADALIVRQDADITAQLDPAKDIFMWMSRTEMFINTGILVVRNNPWSRWLLDQVWNSKLSPEHPWWEQAAFLHIIGFRATLGRGDPDAPNDEILAHFGRLHPRWNSLLTDRRIKQPAIRHYAGAPYGSLVALIRRDSTLRFGRDFLMPAIAKAEFKAGFGRRQDGEEAESSEPDRGVLLLWPTTDCDSSPARHSYPCQKVTSPVPTRSARQMVNAR